METVIYTIGFAEKTAREFFTKLKESGVRTVIDVRLNNTSQLAGFTKEHDLPYFLREIAGIEYTHKPELTPTKDILDAYKKKEIDWSEYENRFRRLLIERHIENIVTPHTVDKSCLLCSEPKPDKCHRRLIAEYLRALWTDVKIVHL
ncbi:MAG: DUF488 domain-containing protein [Sedimentisphaerales bacterium]|jgi:uncharacterized protein (DUF488 family)|nr:DUF488 domain-containing protein [Sedimentisphaerales bacterium]